MGKAKRLRAARVPLARTATVDQPSLLSRNRLLTAVGIAAVVAAVLVGASLVSARGDGNGGGSTAIGGGADVEALLDGIPQSGTVLGEDDAPVTLVEYADPQCPFCADWAVRTFPGLVTDYVRAVQLRIEFRGLTFIGAESEQALRAALAAGEQGKLWNVVDLLYGNQGAENSGWVTDEFLRAVGAAVPGLDVDRVLEESDSAEVSAALQEAAVAAESDGVTGTPSFLLGKTGGELQPLEVSSLDPDEFRTAIEKLLDE